MSRAAAFNRDREIGRERRERERREREEREKRRERRVEKGERFRNKKAAESAAAFIHRQYQTTKICKKNPPPSRFWRLLGTCVVHYKRGGGGHYTNVRTR